jgi:hypothetical protein
LNYNTGIYESVGATGQSGVSCAKQFDGAKNYGTTMYFIDISKIGPNEQAFDMHATIIANDPTKLNAVDETGGEVNITNIPPKSIIGCMFNRPNGGYEDLNNTLKPDKPNDPQTTYFFGLYDTRQEALESLITINQTYLDSF